MTQIVKHTVKSIVLSLLFISLFFVVSVSSQDQIQIDTGIIVTENGDVTVFYDEFTGKYAISVRDSSLLSNLYKGHEASHKSYIIPFYGGNIYDENLAESTWIERWSDDIIIVLIREEPEVFFFEEKGNKQIPFLIDENRITKSAYYHKKATKEIIEIIFTPSEWENVIRSDNSRFRITGQVFTIDQNSKNLMDQILREHQNIQSEKTIYDKQETIRSAPFQIEWEGDIYRAPIVQPLPNYEAQTETVISVRFEVRPDGTVGRIQPIIKSEPGIEREVLRTLRTWRFSRLPTNMPQENQFATVTFRFVLE
jgi:hypothetical protein